MESDQNNHHRRKIVKRPPTLDSSSRSYTDSPPNLSQHPSGSQYSSTRISTTSSRSDITQDSLYANSSPARLSLQVTQHDSQPFDADAIFNEVSNNHQRSLNSSTTKLAAPLPPLLPASLNTLSSSPITDGRLLDPKTKASHSQIAAGYKMDRVTPPRSDTGTESPRQRYSDEPGAEHKVKKNIFSGLFNGVKSSPRRPTISTPTNPTHVTHVSIDNATGQFTVGSPHFSDPLSDMVPMQRVLLDSSWALTVSMNLIFRKPLSR